jgi:hypothetical protein
MKDGVYSKLAEQKRPTKLALPVVAHFSVKLLSFDWE